jgi:uncharacterized protein YoxC
MSDVLIIVLIVTLLSIIALAGSAIGVALSVRRDMSRLAATVDQMKGDVQAVVQESRDMVQTAGQTLQQAHVEIAEIGQIVSTAHGWTQRVDRIVGEVDDTIERPIRALGQEVKVLQAGVTAFVTALSNGDQRGRQEERSKDHG